MKQWCRNISLLLLLFSNVAAPQGNDTRVIHRHACYGTNDVSGVDHIGCVERAAMPFEHTLTPGTVWCNDTDCKTRFGVQLHVHSVDCDARRCSVLIHCSDQLFQLAQAGAITAMALFAIIFVLVRTSMPQVRVNGNKSL